MGFGPKRESDLIDLESHEEDGFPIPPAEKYEALVRYLVREKFGTIAALCEKTDLSRPSVQGRILKGQELGTKVLTALARACGVSFKELVELPIKDLRPKVDKHLRLEEEATDEHDSDDALVPVNMYLSEFIQHHVILGQEAFLSEPEEFEEQILLTNLKLFETRVLLGDQIDVPESQTGYQFIRLPSPPAGLRMSLCGFMSPSTELFDYCEDTRKYNNLPRRQNYAFILLILGKEEKARFQEITQHFLETRNALNTLYKTPTKLCLLTINGDFNTSPIHNQQNQAATLKPLLVDDIFELEHQQIKNGSLKYSAELYMKILKTRGNK